MHLFRTKFKNGIVAEFLPPHKPSNKVIILCDGLPTLPAKKKLVQFLSKKNFWVFHIRYAGTWESDGAFLSHEPQKDIDQILTEISQGFTSVWTNEEFVIHPDKVFVMGSSFGGTTALMSSLNTKIDKVIALCPPVDWSNQEETEPLSEIKKIIHDGYGGGYRFSDADWDKLESGTFFNPVNHTEEFDAQKILIMHAKDDKVVSYAPVEKFAKHVGCTFISRKKDGHFSTSYIMKWCVWRKVRKFLCS
ncbi:hypothetical protein C0581_04350 [Candidatus Parcubacteria bacterium]|nr:MAG: hypothetical protein C0581_04350 [Candidatus Parcubacteria bacterium]